MNNKENHHLKNPINERLKFEYELYLKRAIKKDEKTTTEMLKCLREFDLFTNFAGFEAYNNAQADKYINYLFDQKYSLSYIDSSVRELKGFLTWLERKKGWRSKINYEDIGYLNISSNQRREAKAPEYKKSHSYEDIIFVIRQMPYKEIINIRNRALISLNALCSLRISELRTVKIKSLIMEDGKYFIYVNPKDMEVKFAKTRYADFIQLPQDIVDNVINWRDYLISRGFKNKDPLFPKIPNSFNQPNLLESKLLKEGIKQNSSIIDVFKKAFIDAGLEYINPHSFRRTRVKFAMKQSPEYLNATRQSLGHKNIDTTLVSYGDLSIDDQRKIIGNIEVVKDG
jgi:integrase/recombinase XerD